MAQVYATVRTTAYSIHLKSSTTHSVNARYPNQLQFYHTVSNTATLTHAHNGRQALGHHAHRHVAKSADVIVELHVYLNRPKSSHLNVCRVRVERHRTPTSVRCSVTASGTRASGQHVRLHARPDFVHVR